MSAIINQKVKYLFSNLFMKINIRGMLLNLYILSCLLGEASKSILANSSMLLHRKG